MSRVISDLDLATADLDSTSEDIVLENLEAFMRCGGTFTWPEWCRFPIDDRARIVAVACKVVKERQGMLADVICDRLVGAVEGGIEDHEENRALDILTEKLGK